MNKGEIWLINLDPTIGAEIKKTRFAIIVNDNTLGRLPLKIIVPLTDWKEKYSVSLQKRSFNFAIDVINLLRTKKGFYCNSTQFCFHSKRLYFGSMVFYGYSIAFSFQSLFF